MESLQVKWTNDREYQSEDGQVLVVLEWIGEGDHGDCLLGEDVPRVRVTTFRRFDETESIEKILQLCEPDSYEPGDWMQVNNGSYCTMIDANSPDDELDKIGKRFLEILETDIRNYDKAAVRKLKELSWVQNSNFKFPSDE